MAISPKTCAVCGTVYQPRSWNSTMTPLCSEACKAKRREERRKKIELPCAECGKTAVCVGRKGLTQARTGRAYCSEECKRVYTARISSERMARTNREYASERMKQKNPMRDPAAKARMKTTLRAMGWKPPKRGGNGQLTVPQLLLSVALGWETEVPVRTEKPKGSGYPGAYKVDIGNALLKVAIEVDGGSHSSLARRAEDQKRDALLVSLGWTVLRFSNQEVLTDLDGCVQRVLSTISKSKGTTTISRMAS
jgi:endogenous inhibitor of DNA gyrase (YacG/DUF329 family)